MIGDGFMKQKRRRMAWILSMVMICALFMESVQLKAVAKGVGTTFTVNITDTTNTSGNMVEYMLDGEADWKTVTSGTSIDISDKSNITVKVTKAEGVRVSATSTTWVDCMGVTGSVGQRFDLEDGQSYTLGIAFTKDGGNNPNPGENPEPNPNPQTTGLNFRLSYQNQATGEVIYKLSNDGINWTNEEKLTKSKENIDFVTDGYKYISIRVTGDFFDGYFRENDRGLNIDYKALVSEKGQQFELKPQSVYEFQIDFDKKKTIVWSEDSNFGDDAVVANGTVDILKINGQDCKNEQNGNGGYVQLLPGDVVTIQLKPNYGYQLKEASLNGTTIVAQNEVSTFTFTMPDTNLHLAALFVKTEDQVDCSKSQVVQNVSITNGKNAADSGNLKMTVADNSNYAIDVTSAVNGNSVTKVASVDLTLDNVVSKGNDTYWENNITEFQDDITVGLKLDSASLADGEIYSVVRDHNGSLTELPVIYDDSTGTLSFATNQFSTYTIVKKQATKTTMPGTERTNSAGMKAVKSAQAPKTGETTIPYMWFVIAVLSGVGAVYFGKKKKIVK